MRPIGLLLIPVFAMIIGGAPALAGEAAPAPPPVDWTDEDVKAAAAQLGADLAKWIAHLPEPAKDAPRPKALVMPLKNRSKHQVALRDLTDQVRAAAAKTDRIEFLGGESEAGRKLVAEYEYAASGMVAPGGFKPGTDYVLLCDIQSIPVRQSSGVVDQYWLRMTMVDAAKGTKAWQNEQEIVRQVREAPVVAGEPADAAAVQAKLADILRRLGDDDFQVREKASADLAALGPRAAPLVAAHVNHRDPEVAMRVQEGLARLAGRPGRAVDGLTLSAALAGTKPRPGGVVTLWLTVKNTSDQEISVFRTFWSLALQAEHDKGTGHARTIFAEMGAEIVPQDFLVLKPGESFGCLMDADPVKGAKGAELTQAYLELTMPAKAREAVKGRAFSGAEELVSGPIEMTWAAEAAAPDGAAEELAESFLKGAPGAADRLRPDQKDAAAAALALRALRSGLRRADDGERWKFLTFACRHPHAATEDDVVDFLARWGPRLITDDRELFASLKGFIAALPRERRATSIEKSRAGPRRLPLQPGLHPRQEGGPRGHRRAGRQPSAEELDGLEPGHALPAGQGRHRAGPQARQGGGGGQRSGGPRLPLPGGHAGRLSRGHGQLRQGPGARAAGLRRAAGRRRRARRVRGARRPVHGAGRRRQGRAPGQGPGAAAAALGGVAGRAALAPEDREAGADPRRDQAAAPGLLRLRPRGGQGAAVIRGSKPAMEPDAPQAEEE
jgi:hypothetical protein